MSRYTLASDRDAELIRQATEARRHAYVPYSRFPVGAALRAADGRVFTGVNVENASFGLTCCAERNAVFKAVSEGVREFESIAVVADTPGPVSPCGACRQVLAEFNPNLRVVLTNLRGDVTITSPRELLPGFFAADDMSQAGGEPAAGPTSDRRDD